MRWRIEACRQAPEGDGGAPNGVDEQSMGDQRVVEPNDPPQADGGPGSGYVSSESMGDQRVQEPVGADPQATGDAPASENTDEQSMGQAAAYADPSLFGEALQMMQAQIGQLHDRITGLEKRLKHF